jgi:hypothetical protein
MTKLYQAEKQVKFAECGNANLPFVEITGVTW